MVVVLILLALGLVALEAVGPERVAARRTSAPTSAAFAGDSAFSAFAVGLFEITLKVILVPVWSAPIFGSPIWVSAAATLVFLVALGWVAARLDLTPEDRLSAGLLRLLRTATDLPTSAARAYARARVRRSGLALAGPLCLALALLLQTGRLPLAP
ncbi:MAG: hypothetical protein AAGJ96_11275 [Pseudomonadota bacterium]